LFTTNVHTIHIVATVILFDAALLAVLAISLLLLTRKKNLAVAASATIAVTVVFMGVMFVTALAVMLTRALIPQWAFRDALGIFFVPVMAARIFLREKKSSRRSKAQIQTNSLNQPQAISPDPFQANPPDLHQ
jgi:hypothetical protein